MRLIDLAPAWVSLAPTKTSRTQKGVGITFHCPSCWVKRGELAHRMGVLFMNTLDGGKSVPMTAGLTYDDADPDDKLKADYNNNGCRWARSGMTFEDLTLSPSLDAGHWHGNITAGNVTTSNP